MRRTNLSSPLLFLVPFNANGVAFRSNERSHRYLYDDFVSLVEGPLSAFPPPDLQSRSICYNARFTRADLSPLIPLVGGFPISGNPLYTPVLLERILHPFPPSLISHFSPCWAIGPVPSWAHVTPTALRLHPFQKVTLLYSLQLRRFYSTIRTPQSSPSPPPQMTRYSCVRRTGPRNPLPQHLRCSLPERRTYFLQPSRAFFPFLVG